MGFWALVSTSIVCYGGAIVAMTPPIDFTWREGWQRGDRSGASGQVASGKNHESCVCVGVRCVCALRV